MKNLLINFLEAIIASSLLLSCGQFDSEIDNGSQSGKNKANYKTTDMCMAEEALYNFVGSLPGTTKTEKGDIIIKNVRRSCHTKSGVDYPLPVYEMDIESQDGVEGFAVVGDSSIQHQVFVYVPYGSIQDTISYSPISSYFRELYASLQSCSIQTKNDYDGNRVGVLFNAPDWSTQEYIRDITEDEAAWYNAHQDSLAFGLHYNYAGCGISTQWDQDEPYNWEAPYYLDTATSTYKHYLVGCVPISVGQTLAFMHVPSNRDWSLILQSPTISTSQTARAHAVSSFLTYDVAYYLNTVYSIGDGGTPVGGTYGYAVGDLLDHYGISYDYITAQPGAPMIVFNRDLYSIMLENPNPMIVGGARHVTVSGEVKSYSHSWVVDLVMRQGKWFYKTTKTNGIYKLYKYCAYGYLNSCRWGWGGSYDGWYYSFYPSYNKQYIYEINAYVNLVKE
ncbi:MAG: C10 family peptidase [Bacteroidales bacterium]|nr:C10 family peptidase [Bacteroidales bacterium]